MRKHLRLGLVIAVVMTAALAAVASAGAARHRWQPPKLISPTVHPAVTAFRANPPAIAAAIPQLGGPGSCSVGAGVISSCYRPQDIRQIYNIPDPATSQIDGKGQTIMIVDAFGSPTIREDLQAFDQAFGLPDPQLTIYEPTKNDPTADPANVAGWAGETSLDVQWAHAIAPGAKIVLVVAPSDDSRVMARLQLKAVAKYHGAIVSMSFGSDETFARSGVVDEVTLHASFVLGNVFDDTFVASSGDQGSSGVTALFETGTATRAVAEYPASDPLVTGVGGTQSNLYFDGDAAGSLLVGTESWQNGGYGSEETWNEDVFGTVPGGVTGGAPSVIFPAPSWQASASHNAKRTVPDVAYNAGVYGGVIVFVDGAPSIFGGTSAGTPQWAGIVALANQARGLQGKPKLGFINDDLYAIYNSPRYATDFHDILKSPEIADAFAQGGVPNGHESGETLVDGPGGPASVGFDAGRGYDLTTGIGTPNVGNLLQDLVGRR